jgi:hypothetical protein
MSTSPSHSPIETSPTGEQTLKRFLVLKDTPARPIGC